MLVRVFDDTIKIKSRIAWIFFLFMHFLNSFNERTSADRTKRISERNHFKLFHSSTSSCVLCWIWFWIFFSLWFLKVHFFSFLLFRNTLTAIFFISSMTFYATSNFVLVHIQVLFITLRTRIYARLCSISEWNRIEKKCCDDDGGKKTTATTKVIVSHPFFPFGSILVQGHLQGKEGVWELLINQSGSTSKAKRCRGKEFGDAYEEVDDRRSLDSCDAVTM